MTLIAELCGDSFFPPLYFEVQGCSIKILGIIFRLDSALAVICPRVGQLIESHYGKINTSINDCHLINYDLKVYLDHIRKARHIKLRDAESVTHQWLV